MRKFIQIITIILVLFAGKSNNQDVDIVFDILDNVIIKEKGRIGTYKSDNSFFNKQMIHIDCRGYRARWN